MRNRKIRVDIKTDKVKEVLDKLNKNSEFITLDLDIEENKDIYKYLSTSDNIISWDFIEVEEKEAKENSITEVSKVIEMEDSSIIDPIAITNYNEFATYVEAVWRVSRKSPTLIWGSNFFNKVVNDEYSIVATSPLTLEHGLLVMILQTYYRDTEIMEALNDTNNKLKNNWNKLKDHLSLASVSKMLYE
jgi:23S rRNA pseudoU1915 N3-methylase RlmH